MAEISKEEKKYVNLPRFYSFGDKKEQILTENFRRINEEVKCMCQEVLNS